MGRRRDDDDDDIIMDVSGKPATFMFNNALTPGQWGKTTFELTPNRLRERTKFLFAERYIEVFLSDVKGVEWLTTPNPALLVLGIPLIAAFGFGIILIILSFVFKYRFLVVRTTSYALALTMKGRMDPYLDFMEAILEEAERLNSKPSKGGVSPAVVEAAAAPAPRVEAHPAVRDHVAGGEGKSAGGVVRCPECDAEYRLPPGPAGRKFRCKKCQAVIEA